MSDPIARYNADIEVDIHYPQVVMRRASDGEWVDYDDHQAEVERLTNKLNENNQNFQIECQSAEIEMLRAEVERLREALRGLLDALSLREKRDNREAVDAAEAALAGGGGRR
jgi:hypothetical protein